MALIIAETNRNVNGIGGIEFLILDWAIQNPENATRDSRRET